MGRARRTRIVLAVLFLALVAGLVLFSVAAGKIEEWLWMTQLGYGPIFWRILGTKLLLFGAAFVVVFLYFWVNIRIILRTGRKRDDENYVLVIQGVENIGAKVARIAALLTSFFLAVTFGLIFYSQWDTYLRFQWGGFYAQVDPVFHLDLGFYLFRLPFYELVQNSLLGLTLIAFLLCLLTYFGLGAFNTDLRPTAMKHLSVIFLFFLAAWSWGYYLDRYELLFSTRGVVYGMGYTDYHVLRICLWIMLVASVFLGGFILLSLLALRFGWIRTGIAGYFGLMVLLLFLLPAIIQKFVVQPNELALEAPFLKQNIDFTRRAYLLDKVEERSYPALAGLTGKEIAVNQETLRNVRLWDWRPIRQTFRQTQEIRLYYRFYEVDVDRYHLGNGGYRQVMLSARELVEQLPEKARTWVNQYLQFTHGYGLAMAFVSEQVEGGLPRYVVKDFPPVSSHLRVDQPAIYYGEKMPGYRIVNTKVEEFDYPKGDQNVYTHYQGEGGIPFDRFWKRVLFAWTRSDVNILISSYITPESRIQIWREVQERISMIAPFLELDQDPYLVLSNGKLYWIQDAYTVSSNFPYSEPYMRRLNYIRNSVKIVIDAYHGSVAFYMIDTKDPVLGVYGRLFPGVFKNIEEMSEGLRRHLRYPEDLFIIQVDKFRTYHMTIPQVFYNREDLWTLPKEKYAGEPQPMEPYYILMRLPGEDKLEYIMIIPLTPEKKDNMIAWMAAKSDLPDYGRLIFYQLPKERLVLGPMQVEAMIDQDALISQQISLWDQRGSRVIRGNLLVIPIDHSFIYVEPVYIVAETNDIPQLKRVIVAHESRVAMEPTFEEAIHAVIGARRPAEKAVVPAVEGETLTNRIRAEFERAEKAMREGKWAEFGRAMESLKQLLGK